MAYNNINEVMESFKANHKMSMLSGVHPEVTATLPQPWGQVQEVTVWYLVDGDSEQRGAIYRVGPPCPHCSGSGYEPKGTPQHKAGIVGCSMCGGFGA